MLPQPRLSAHPGAAVQPSGRSEGPGRRGIVSFSVDGWNARDVALRLSEVHGIGVRDGMVCARPLVRHLLNGERRHRYGRGACRSARGRPRPRHHWELSACSSM
ncbi:aminotransferase class V-fold PLP-dependent enzyme [Actinomadura sp. NBRC 104412]|uniref:aminotransferase class V-fold PLP-dependent enzyme n=1 Tax=Actinomadura sp. NBRC 104412 TaxID=3032203 RepID=UPI0025522374|nr:aminotransferase class V-fold PLP-dependent enzyme [Actinomadura sp. NBRC 104412]